MKYFHSITQKINQSVVVGGLGMLLFIVFLTACSTTKSTKKTRSKNDATNNAAANLANSNDISIVGIKSKFLSKDSTYITIFLRADLLKSNNTPIRLKEFAERFTLNYVIYPDFASRERLGYGNIVLTEANVTQTSLSQFMVRFDVKKPANYNAAVLLAELSETGTTKKVLNDLQIRFRATKLSDRFTLFERTGRFPLLQNYATVHDTVLLQDVMGEKKKLYVLRYRHDFDPAVSPMNTTPRNAARTLGVDSTFFITTGTPLVFRQEGLYFMVEDTLDASGIGVVISNKRFPKMTRPEELTRPVMYMSQSQEITNLLNTKDSKKELDRYWLTLMSGNTDIAKRTIKVFYHRVEESNRLFTTYKEGWKTDKGMIFIVIGPPDRVQRSKDREVWVYGQRANFAEINFTFNRRPNQFVEDHYELQRYVEYQPIWYPMVEAWRSGNVRE